MNVKPGSDNLVKDEDGSNRACSITQEGKVIGRFRATGVRPKCCELLKACGINLPTEMFEGVTEVR